jgi:hypothetical protein
MTQKERIIKKLMLDGYVTRNQCLRNFISRLSAIIQDLEEEGWVFKTSRNGGNYKTEADYRYDVVSSPLQEIVYKVGDREIKTYARK